MFLLFITHREFNIAPENGWLEDYLPFGRITFQGLQYVKLRGCSTWDSPQAGFAEWGKIKTNYELGFGSFMFLLFITHRELNIAPENGWLEDYLPFGRITFQGLQYVKLRGCSTWDSPQAGFAEWAKIKTNYELGFGSFMFLLFITHREFNIAHENGWLEDYLPFGRITFQGLQYVKLRGCSTWDSPQAGFAEWGKIKTNYELGFGSFMFLLFITHREFDIAHENGWLEDYLPFGRITFQGLQYVKLRGCSTWDSPQAGFAEWGKIKTNYELGFGSFMFLLDWQLLCNHSHAVMA